MSSGKRWTRGRGSPGDFFAHINHIVAGAVDTFYFVVIGTRTLRDHLLFFALPTVAGHMLGGVSLVALLGHAQVHT